MRSETHGLTTRARIARSALALFDDQGVDSTSVAQICRHAGVSNGSFFHAFANRERLCSALYLDALDSYHRAMVAALADDPDAARGIAALVTAHLDWVVNERAQSRFLFAQARADWLDTAESRQAQKQENARFADSLGRWRLSRESEGELDPLAPGMFIAQLIGPAQILCRAWLAGRIAADPREEADTLIACARRVLLPG